MINAHAIQSIADPVQSNLVFNKYREEYFLCQVWTGGSNTGHQLRQSPREIELAAAAKAQKPGARAEQVTDMAAGS
jgi:hypothetical protein